MAARSWRLPAAVVLAATLIGGATSSVRAGSDQLYGVSCVSKTWCMAVGDRSAAGSGTADDFRPLAELWDGRTWHVLPMAGPTRLPVTGSGGRQAAVFSQLSCRRFTSWCMTVGTSYRPGMVTGGAAIGEILNNESHVVTAIANP
jgi:hypothetical protein